MLYFNNLNLIMQFQEPKAILIYSWNQCYFFPTLTKTLTSDSQFRNKNRKKIQKLLSRNKEKSSKIQPFYFFRLTKTK